MSSFKSLRSTKEVMMGGLMSMPIHHIEAILACREALDRLEQENKVMVDGPNEGLEGVMVYEIVDEPGAI